MSSRRLVSSFVLQWTTPTWGETAYGYAEGWLRDDDVIALAAERVARGAATDDERAMAASTAGKRGELKETLERLVAADVAVEPADVRLVWMRLMLAWLYENRDAFEDSLGVVHEIYAHFDYAAEMRHLAQHEEAVRVPRENESWTDHAVRLWQEYLERVFRRDESVSDARKLVGKEIARIDRIFYEFRGDVDAAHGALELHLSDGSVLLFDGASDGDSLRIVAGPWEDSFAEPMSEENRAFVAKHGKWCRHAVSTQDRYRDLIGAVVNAVEMLENQHRCKSGIALETGARKLWLVVEADETNLYWGAPLGHRVHSRHAAGVGVPPEEGRG